MALIWRVVLLFLAVLHALATTSNAHDDGNLILRCHPGQAAILLQLKNSFIIYKSATNLPSWQDGTDCCHWEGVSCDGSSDRVTALNLSGRGLYSSSLDSVIFNLTSLRFLDLSKNNFAHSMLPAIGFEKLTFLAHLNLSNSRFWDEIPIGIGKLKNLISLDLSGPDNSFWISDFQALVGNLGNLRELYLDDASMSSRQDWCSTLAKSVPRLQVLSLGGCYGAGPIHQSLSNLSSLTVINLQGNYDTFTGQFPEFFMDFVNLSVLQLSYTDLEGWFPPRSFQSKKLRVLDLSRNTYLSGSLPNFSNASSLQALRLDGTNLSFSKLCSCNFLSLQELALDANFVSTEFFSSFNILPSLSQLRLSGSGFLGDLGSIFSWIGDLNNLTSLELSECDFSGTKPFSISKFSNLRSLSIVTCNHTLSILSAIGNLMDLQSLDMSGCEVNGPMPSSIGNLTNLRRLDISDGGFLGPIPSSVGNLLDLRSMSLSSSGFSGAIPFELGQLKELTSLLLGDNKFTGGIPKSIGNLSHLQYLDLSRNYLNGEIPESLFTLPLQHLDLSQNQLSGPINEFIMASPVLKYLGLDRNELTGQIPRSFLELTSLRKLYIGWNNLVGLVGLASFWRLTKLTDLSLSHNKLSIMDGEGDNNCSSTYLSGLSTLELAHCNITEFPNVLTRLSDVRHLDLSCNRLSGDIPKWIWERWDSLTSLNLSHNMFTGMQLNSSVIISRVNVLDLSSNRLQGQIPMLYSSGVLDYSHNNFSSMASYFECTTFLRVSNNSIKGHIPDSICNCRVSIFDLSYNKFSGPIPSCLLENVALSVLNLRENQFEGTLPSNITSGCTLRTIDLHGNNIEGQLPMALTNCSKLEVLDIGDNLIVDTFPSWLGELPNLYVLILRSNQFYGSIDYLVGSHPSREHFSSLQIIDLASNKFSGILGPEWFGRLKSMTAKLNSTGHTVIAQNISPAPGAFYQDSIEITYKGLSVTFAKILTTLTAIDFSNNRLEGTIPESVGKLVSLHVLNMSHNAFTGKIPSQLGGMTNLESLDLSCNQLQGEIPQELTALTFLSTLNLSDNQLVGKIPQSHQLSTFENNSFQGNLGLCGPPLSNPCGVPPSPSEVHAEKSSHVDVVLFLFVGLGFGVGFAAAILMRWGHIGEWFVKSARALRT